LKHPEWIILTAVLLMCSISLTAQHGFKWPLDSLMRAVERANPALRMYDAEISSMYAAAKGARSWMPPQVDAGFWMTPYNPKWWHVDNQGNPGMGQFMVSVQQMLPNRRKQAAQTAWMQSMSAVGVSQKNATLNQLRADTKRHYYAWGILKRKAQVLHQNEDLLQYMQKNAEIRYQYGMDKLGAYYKVQAARGKLHNMDLMLLAEMDQHRIALNTLLNQDKIATLDVDTTYSLNTNILALSDSSKIWSSRSDLCAIDQEIKANELKIISEQAQLLPEYGIRFDHMLGWAQQPAQFTLMGMVRLPFAGWARKMTDANIESLNWKTEVLRSKKNMLFNEATGMAASMRSEITWKQQQLRVYEKEILPALLKNFQTIQLGFEQNKEELFMLYDAWDTLNMTQLEYLDRLGEVFQLQTSLEEALEIGL
jgi:outer membrane protein TolC